MPMGLHCAGRRVGGAGDRSLPTSRQAAPCCGCAALPSLSCAALCYGGPAQRRGGGLTGAAVGARIPRGERGGTAAGRSSTAGGQGSAAWPSAASRASVPATCSGSSSGNSGSGGGSGSSAGVRGSARDPPLCPPLPPPAAHRRERGSAVEQGPIRRHVVLAVEAAHRVVHAAHALGAAWAGERGAASGAGRLTQLRGRLPGCARWLTAAHVPAPLPPSPASFPTRDRVACGHHGRLAVYGRRGGAANERGEQRGGGRRRCCPPGRGRHGANVSRRPGTPRPSSTGDPKGAQGVQAPEQVWPCCSRARGLAGVELQNLQASARRMQLRDPVLASGKARAKARRP